ncbi:hypothetical protein RRG08_015897 [Elysia crispata]|uniref:Uncharacterized protein n=1 Tax=Elysia crispata TaxID=231223 RepID=A0AAE1E1E9_9GAST|nr:hypothetical protein RRG08_015897 [Elysia crispata]
MHEWLPKLLKYLPIDMFDVFFRKENAVWASVTGIEPDEIKLQKKFLWKFKTEDSSFLLNGLERELFKSGTVHMVIVLSALSPLFQADHKTSHSSFVSCLHMPQKLFVKNSEVLHPLIIHRN